MASAYVALLSLNSSIQQNQDTLDLEYLKELSAFLLEFFEEHHNLKRISLLHDILDLEIRTKNVALKLSCVIDSYAMDQMFIKHGRSGDNSSKLFTQGDVDGMIKEFESIKAIAIHLKYWPTFQQNMSHPSSSNDVRTGGPSKRAHPSSSNDAGPSKSARTGHSSHVRTGPSTRVHNNDMVGFGQHLLAVMERIMGSDATLKILPVVGMGGIGKTILTQNVFDMKLVKEHFHIRLWATISQSYKAGDILSSLLQHLNIHILSTSMHDLKIAGDQISPPHSNEIGEKLYKALFGRRYLIVMDDIWDVKVWDEIRRFFPNNDNRSRIVLTTRLQSVASHIGSCDPYKLEYLDEDESWNLLERKVFAQDGCPSKLEGVGRRIAVSCRGLPLAIVVIAGHLAKSDMTKESWENVAGDLISIIHSENDSECLKTLSLSFDNLPLYLKPCFLYMAFFRKGIELRVPQTIKHWVADGLLKPTGDQCLEDRAMEYLTDLVERNLISVSKRGSGGKIKCIRIHDLLHDLCSRKSHEHQFIYNGVDENGPTLGVETKSNSVSNIPLSKFSVRFSSFDLSSSNWENKWAHQGADHNLWDFRLRYLSLTASQALDISTFSASLASIFMFQNSQTLEIEEMPGNEPVVLPPEIWEMPVLKHLLSTRVALPDPPTAATHDVMGNESCVLSNLLTLQDVHCFKVSEEVVRRIPNLKKLKITYTKVSESTTEWSLYGLHNLAQLCKLESLIFTVCRKISALDFSLPQSLKKLVLDGCKLPFEDMSMVGLLPNLEVLRLQNDAFSGREWRPIEGEFCHLKVLHLRNMSLQQWEADSRHFPRLERLILYNIWSLKEIPLSIGDIATIQFISAEFCRFSLESSVRQLIVEQRNMGNNDIKVHLPRVFFMDSSDTVDIMKSVLCFLFSFLYYNTDLPHETSVMIEKFEDNLHKLQTFLSNTTKEERTGERLKGLVKHIRDVMYEAVDITYTATMQADKGKSLSYLFRRAINVVKEVEYITVKVQRLRLCVGDGLDEEEFVSYKDLRNLVDYNTEDEAYNFRLLQLISQHMNKLVPDWLKKNQEMAKYLEPVGDKSTIQVLFRDFSVLTAVDGISVENELNQDKISTVHTGIVCDDCETEPIIGVRYRCKDCVVGLGFDLCEECYTSGLESDHTDFNNHEKHTSDHEFEMLTSIIKPSNFTS